MTPANLFPDVINLFRILHVLLLVSKKLCMSVGAHILIASQCKKGGLERDFFHQRICTERSVIIK